MTLAGPIARTLVLADFEKSGARALAADLEAWLGKRGVVVEVRPEVRAFGRGASLKRPELLVVLGGDGAILSAARAFSAAPVPILGINLGQVGFLASTPAESWREALASVLAGEAVVEPRMRLEASFESEGQRRHALALNEFTLQRSAQQGMIQAALWAGPDWVTNYRADGVIVATPSGSTAYSLSAGGPILEPSLEALVVTPICPQALSNRALVLPAGVELTLRVDSAASDPVLAVDGHEYHRLAEGAMVQVRRHPVAVPMLWMRGMDPYRRLRERLGWAGGPNRERPEGPV